VDIVKTISDFVKERLNLDNFKAHESETIDSVKRNVEFRGTNLWILIFAIMLASVGLNVNSTAVIIGAMLISPLMGPIMGLGLGAAINDFALVKKSGKNLLIATVISIMTSAVYFYLTPLDEAQSELLSRTSPSIWDVLIAFFGGMAGIIASSSKEKGNVIPGVAIATALMPPLCTAGYGLANGEFVFFFGAFYLYFINTVFIFISTFIVIRFLKYKKVQFVDRVREKQVKRYIMILVIITVVPSTFLAYNIVQKTIFQRSANSFIANEFALPNAQIVNKTLTFESGHSVIDVLVVGEPISEEEQRMIRGKMLNYGLDKCELIIRQGAAGMGRFDIATLKSDIFEDLYDKNQQVVKEKDVIIDSLAVKLESYEKRDLHSDEIYKEVKALYPIIKEFSMKLGGLHSDENVSDSTCLVWVRFSAKPDKNELSTMQNWLKVRTGFNKVRVIQY